MLIRLRRIAPQASKVAYFRLFFQNNIIAVDEMIPNQISSTRVRYNIHANLAATLPFLKKTTAQLNPDTFHFPIQLLLPMSQTSLALYSKNILCAFIIPPESRYCFTSLAGTA